MSKTTYDIYTFMERQKDARALQGLLILVNTLWSESSSVIAELSLMERKLYSSYLIPCTFWLAYVRLA